jgi:1-acyl-sn-glycerol-3-phosphate acyltransferase
MNYLRAIIRAAALCVLTAAVYALMMAGSLARFASGSARSKWRAFCFKTWAKAAARIINLKISTGGLFPRAPFILVSNHLSYVDVVLLASLLDCVFVAKSDVARWPVIGRLCRSVGTIFVDRRRRADVVRVNRLIGQTLAGGKGVVLFAEGTSTDGLSVRPFKPSLLETAARAGFAVSYSAITYRTRGADAPARLSVCWWGEMVFLNHLFALLGLGEVRAAVSFGAEKIQEGDRKALAHKLWSAVSGQLTTLVNGEEQCAAHTN